MHNNPPDSQFSLLINDLEALRDAREIRENARQARMATEAARNRRLHHVQRQQVKRSVLAKAAPVDQPAPNFEAIAARQDKIAAEMEQARLQAQQDAIRAHLATLAAAAKAGRLTAHQACLLDVYRGQALSLGLEP